MKLNKALKYKKRLGADIANLQILIKNKNSFKAVNKVNEEYDVKELMKELASKLTELVKLKVDINNANIAIQEKLYNIAEAKGLKSFLGDIPTRAGLITRYSADSEVEYVAQLNEKEVALLINDAQDVIDKLQEEIDTFNYTTEI